MTMVAAPYRRIKRAWRRNSASPSFMEMEFTTHFPCATLRPASMMDHLEESIMMGTRAMSGSAAIKFRNVVMASSPSMRPSSILISIIWAPPSTCSRAMARASSYCSSRMRRANRRLPVTLVRSPMLTKLDSGVTINGSRPESFSGRWAFDVLISRRLMRNSGFEA